MPRTFTTRPYSKVVRDLWGDDKFVALTAMRPSGQALWMYLLTGPHGNVIPGLFVSMGIGTLADRLKWPTKDVQKHWTEIATQKMAKADWNAGVIWLPNGFRHNEPANPNVVTNWRNVPLPQGALVIEALKSLRAKLWTLEIERMQKAVRKQEDPRRSLGWVQSFDQVFAKKFEAATMPRLPLDFPAALIEWLPEGFGEPIKEGLGEGFLEGLGEESAKGVGGTLPPRVEGVQEQEQDQDQEQDPNTSTPLAPLAGGNAQSSPRKAKAKTPAPKASITRRERKAAEDVIDEFGCPHAHPEAKPAVPECPTREECIGRIVGENRLLEERGLEAGAA